jgi:hypothetical protein
MAEHHAGEAERAEVWPLLEEAAHRSRLTLVILDPRGLLFSQFAGLRINPI